MIIIVDIYWQNTQLRLFFLIAALWHNWKLHLDDVYLNVIFNRKWILPLGSETVSFLGGLKFQWEKLSFPPHIPTVFFLRDYPCCQFLLYPSINLLKCNYIMEVRDKKNVRLNYISMVWLLIFYLLMTTLESLAYDTTVEDELKC